MGNLGPVWVPGPRPLRQLDYSSELHAALSAWQQEWNARSGDWPDVDRWIAQGHDLVQRLQAELGPRFSVSLGIGVDKGCRADLLVRSPEDLGSPDPPLDRLRTQASSRDFAERARAGVRLVGYAEHPAAVDLLLELLLDAENTFVTQEVSEALLARADVASLRLYAKGWHLADSDQGQHFGLPIALVQARRLVWEGLAIDPDGDVASGAREVLAWVDGQSQKSSQSR